MAARGGGLWRHEFSNFYVEPDGTNVEKEFQLAKHDGKPIYQLVIAKAKTPRRAKELGADLRLTKEELAAWEARRVPVMLQLVDQKAMEWDAIADALMAVNKNKPIVEYNRHHDNFWGDCTCNKPSCKKPGNNALGEIWMLIRRRLLESRLPGMWNEQDMHLIEAISAAAVPRSR